MFWAVFTTIVLLLAYFGDEKITKDSRTRAIARSLLVLVLAYAIALCGESTDRVAVIYRFEHELHFYHFKNIMDWLSFQSDESEVGFILLNKICYMIGLSGIGLLFVISLITNGILVNLLYKFRYPVLVFFLYIVSYYYLQQTNLARQILASAIGLLSLPFLIKKDWKKYALFMFMAFTIHKTSLILLLLAPLFFVNEKREKLANYVLVGLWVVSLGALFGKGPSFEYFAIFFDDTRYEYYTMDEDALGIDSVVLDLFYNAFVLFYFLFGKKQNIVYVAVFVLGCVFENLAYGSKVMVRMSLYFIPLYCALVPTIIAENNAIDGKDRKTILTTHFLVFFYYFRLLFKGRIVSSFTQIGGHIDGLFDIFR